MEDKSFIDLISDKNINKMSIDERLIPYFKKMMKYMGKYFNYMGYTKERNYKEFFDKYLLHPYYKLLIQCNNKPNNKACDGYFSYSENKLVISEELLKESIGDILGVFTHEFIHFLVVDNIKNKNEFLTNYYSINEAMTEILKNRIFPQ